VLAIQPVAATFAQLRIIDDSDNNDKVIIAVADNINNTTSSVGAAAAAPAAAAAAVVVGTAAAAVPTHRRPRGYTHRILNPLARERARRRAIRKANSTTTSSAERQPAAAAAPPSLLLAASCSDNNTNTNTGDDVLFADADAAASVITMDVVALSDGLFDGLDMDVFYDTAGLSVFDGLAANSGDVFFADADADASADADVAFVDAFFVAAPAGGA
jgi:hypothetical protein